MIITGADLGVSRGGGGADFHENFEKVLSILILRVLLIFRVLLKQYEDAVSVKFSAPQASFWALFGKI